MTGLASHDVQSGLEADTRLRRFLRIAFRLLRSSGSGLFRWSATVLLGALGNGVQMGLGFVVGLWIVVVVIWEAVTDFLPLTSAVLRMTIKLIGFIFRFILSTL